jgi:hypothetical protein
MSAFKNGVNKAYSVSMFSLSLALAPLNNSYSACKEHISSKLKSYVNYGEYPIVS